MGTGGGRRPGPGVLAGALLAGLLAVGLPGPADAAMPAPRVGATTVWLCRPDQGADPCTSSRAATAVTGKGATRLALSPSTPQARRFDCFYVYPTVSSEQTDNADLTVQPAEEAAALVQASRFSQRCTVWAPMYRQATVAALRTGAAVQPSVAAIAFNSLLSAWKDYLAHDNHGRPIIFIGHSQGSSVLIKLLQTQIDPSPHLRKRMVSAIILGGNVQVPTGKVVGGSFRHIPTCGAATQTGCVIAYSSFGSPPPANSFFGRAGRGVSLLSGQGGAGTQQVACVNPVTFSARAGALEPYLRRATTPSTGVGASTPWVTFPGLYTGQCMQRSGASWLQVTATPAPGDPRPTVAATLGSAWGYHSYDVNLALGNLVNDVGLEEAAYR